MDFVEKLPLELSEEIFLYLSSNDIARCCLVNLKWREVLNNNRIWSQICARENLREPLDTEKSYFANPLKRFSSVKNISERLSDLCEWRVQYDRYKFIEHNWRRGRFASFKFSHSSHVLPTYYNDGILVLLNDVELVIQNVRGKVDHVASIKYKYTNEVVDHVVIQKDYIIYSQKKYIIGLKLVDDTYCEVFDIEVHIRETRNNNQEKVMFAVSNNYLVYSNSKCPDKLYIYNIRSNVVEKEIKPEDNIQISCMKAFNDKVYLAVKKVNSHILYEYDLVKGEWCAELTAPAAVSELYVADGILCAKMAVNSTSKLYIWSLNTMCLLSHLSVVSTQPIVITDKLVFHCQNNTVIVHCIATQMESKFVVGADTIINMAIVGFKHSSLLGVHTGSSVEIWDWGTGEKLFTPYRGICNTALWTDVQMLLINLWSSNFEVIGFW